MGARQFVAQGSADAVQLRFDLLGDARGAHADVEVAALQRVVALQPDAFQRREPCLQQAVVRRIEAHLHRGIAGRTFRQTFSLADHVKVTGATLEHGLLAIELVREVPEALKPRRIAIAAGTTRLGQDNAPAQIEGQVRAA